MAEKRLNDCWWCSVKRNPFDGVKLTVELSTEVASELHAMLQTPGIVTISNQQAMDAIAKKSVKPVLSLEERTRVQELVTAGRTTEATKFLTECRIRRAKMELLRRNRGAIVRDILIDTLLREAIEHRKEKV